MNNRHGKNKTPRLIAATRARLATAGVPYVIENVPGAREFMVNFIRLTGEMFGLQVHRPRLFETDWGLLQPRHVRRQKDPVAVYGKEDGRRLWARVDGSELRVANLKTASGAMGINWMTWDEIREAIPPLYAEYIGWSLRFGGG